MMESDLITCEVCGRDFDFTSRGHICPHCDYNNNPSSQWPTGKIKTFNEFSNVRCSNCHENNKGASTSRCPRCGFVEYINITGETNNG